MQRLQKSENIHSINESLDKINVVEEIEKMVLEKKIDYLSAVLELARKLDWDPLWIVPYISGSLKEKLRIEGEKQGLLKRTNHPKILFE